MLDIVLLIFFIVMAFRVVRGVIKESLILGEFKQSRNLAVFVLLFPIGPIALLTLPYRVGWFPAVIVAACCYLPAMLISRSQLRVYDCSGTDRTKRAQNIANQALLGSLVGFIYVGVFLVFIFLGGSINDVLSTKQ